MSNLSRVALVAAAGLFLALCASCVVVDDGDCAGGGCDDICSNCDLHCEGSNCGQTCTAGVCTFWCEGSNCHQICEPGATCTFYCPGGNCVQTCEDGSDCSASCNGGNCTQNCNGAGATCDFTCIGLNCTGYP